MLRLSGFPPNGRSDAAFATSFNEFVGQFLDTDLRTLPLKIVTGLRASG